MRVLFFNRSYWPDLGATGQLLTELAEDLAGRHGCQVSVVTGRPLVTDGGRPGAECPRRESRRGVEIIRAGAGAFDRRAFAGRAANYLLYFCSAWVSSLRLTRPDVVVALTDPPIIGLLGLHVARRHGVPFVFVCEDVFPDVAVALGQLHNPVLEWILERTSRTLISSADRIVALGETMQALLVSKGADPAKMTVIHNWADCRAIQPGQKRNAFSVEYGLADRFVVMHSGNVGLSQDLVLLLDAAERLRSHPDIVIAIVGDGVKRSELEARARARDLANVRFLPFQPRDGLVDSFAAADVFFVSLKRGLAGHIVPSKLYGILAAGRPYVAAVEEACEIAAITRRHDSGLLADPGSPDDVAAKILALSRDRELRTRLGVNARAAALTFDRHRQTDAYHVQFRELSARAGAGRQPAPVAMSSSND